MFFKNSSRGRCIAAGPRRGHRRPAAARPPAGPARRAAVLVLAACALHRTQHQVPGREDRRRQPQRLEVFRKVGGLGFPGGDDAHHPVRSFCRAAYSRARPAGAGRTGPPAPAWQRLAAIFWYSAVFFSSASYMGNLLSRTLSVSHSLASSPKGRAHGGFSALVCKNFF